MGSWSLQKLLQQSARWCAADPRVARRMKVFSAPTRRTVIESAHLRCALPMQHALLTHEDQKLLRVAAAARIAVVLLLALCASLWITPFDSSGGLALRPCSESRYKSCSEASAWERLALPFTQWDTIHFLAIARDGYVDEQKFAFLPGVPALLALAGRLPHALGLSEHAFLPSVAVLIVSMLASCLSWLTPLVLYR